MIIVYDKLNAAKVIRPCPFISISYSTIKNKMGNLGGTYDITLTGTIINDEGSPFSSKAFAAQYEPRPAHENVPVHENLQSILSKQIAIRELFSQDGLKIEVLTPIVNGQGGDEPVLIFYPRVQSINFEEGVYVNICRYTITLQTDFLLDKDEKIFKDGFVLNNFEPDTLLSGNVGSVNHDDLNSAGITIADHIANHGGLVEDFSENWSIEVEDGNGNTYDPTDTVNPLVSRIYRLTRTCNATGKSVYDSTGRYEAWQQAKSFLNKRILDNSDDSSYPKYSTDLNFAKDILNLATTSYGGYNHLRTESIDKTAGSYSVSDTWLLSKEAAYETYSMSVASGITDSIITVSIDGSIKGLTSIPASGNIFGGSYVDGTNNSPYENAINKYRQITSEGSFGPTSYVFKRAQSLIGVALNSQPLSISLGSNEIAGEISYNLEFNTRPTNLIRKVLSEQININDTYPGDVFAVLPVIGRPTGPVLQYIGGRTEYQRNVGIDIVVPDTYGGTARQQLALSKPILLEPYRTDINNLILQLSPALEPGIRKYFLSPPNETWDPKSRRYTLNLTWVYELDH